MFLSTFKKSFPQQKKQKRLMKSLFFKKTTKTTRPTTTNSFSYLEYRNILEEEIFVFFNGIAFFK